MSRLPSGLFKGTVDDLLNHATVDELLVFNKLYENENQNKQAIQDLLKKIRERVYGGKNS